MTASRVRSRSGRVGRDARLTVRPSKPWARARLCGSGRARLPRRQASLLGCAAGGALGLAGIAEALRLAKGGEGALLHGARTTGPVRAAAGSLLLARPRLLPPAVGADPGAGASDWLIRMVAVREIVLGMGLLSTARRRRDPRPWLLSTAAVDGSECLVVLHAVARRRLPAVPALGFAAADLGGALVAAGVLAQLRSDRGAPEPDFRRSPGAPAPTGGETGPS
jgi:hypothetical protein